LRADDLRAPAFRREDDFLPPRRDDLRALPALRLLARFRELFRPDDADRDFFLPPLERLDFLAAAIGNLRVGGFVATDSKIRAQRLTISLAYSNALRMGN
jgi:hypothetical protein